MKTIVMTDRVATRVARPSSPLAAPVKLVRRWFEVADQRRALAAMTDDQLKDIGVSRYEVEVEVSRPFWDIGA